MKKRVLKAELCLALMPYLGKITNYYYVKLKDTLTDESQSVIVSHLALDVELREGLVCEEIIPAFSDEDLIKAQNLYFEFVPAESFDEALLN